MYPEQDERSLAQLRVAGLGGSTDSDHQILSTAEHNDYDSMTCESVQGIHRINDAEAQKSTSQVSGL